LGEKKLEVEKIEEEPAIDELIAVEKEPQVDIVALQKSIEYPEMARKAGIEGQVIVRVLVGKDGKPKKAVVQYTDSKMLDKAAVKAVMKQVFTPAIQNGRAITCWVSIPIKFKLR
jgi:protein TonB